ncbi:MAG: response regulator [Gemmatimonadota bacterium]
MDYELLPRPEDCVVFVIDDDGSVAEAFRRFLARMGYAARAFVSPTEALSELTPDVRLLVVDNQMPEMTGLELVERALETNPEVRFIVVTGAGDEAAAQGALRLGATDYLTKPTEFADLARAVQRALMDQAFSEFRRAKNAWLEEEVERKTAEVRSVSLATLTALLNALESRIPEFKGHSQRVAECGEAIARELGVGEEEIEAIHTAGLLHDIGMISVGDAIVGKRGDLDERERQSIEGHCRRGADILDPLVHLGNARTYVLEHHERLNGSGYPDRKRGAEISLGGQIVGLAEAWVAITEERPFRDAMPPDSAMATLSGASGVWFSEQLLGALRAVVLGSEGTVAPVN